LGRLGNPQTIQLLIEALQDEDKWVRRQAAEALGKLDGPHTLQLFNLALRDVDKWVRQAATTALAENMNRLNNISILHRICRMARQALSDRDEEVRKQAQQTLEQATQRLALVQVNTQPALDILIEPPHRGWSKHVGGGLIGLGLFLLTTLLALSQNIRSSRLEVYLSANAIGLFSLLALVVIAPLLILILQRWRQRRL
jgi:HEAT repeat protein